MPTEENSRTGFKMLPTALTNYVAVWQFTASCLPIQVIPRVHNERREGEYPTSLIWPNALHKVIT